MPLVQTRGAASAQGFGEFAQASAPVYVEDVFSTYIYSGSASTQTLTNNIDLSGKGGLVWIKNRNDALNNILFDTARGDFELISNSTAVQADNNRDFVPLSTGFSLKGGENVTNNVSNTYVSWTFRKQPKFFDIITYTGNGTSPRQISHNLGSTPGCVMIKKTSGSAAAWQVWNRGVSSPAGAFGVLNDTLAFGVNSDAFYFSNPTSTYVTVGSADTVNTIGATYVMYLFAHDAGGFGLTGTDNVISCGSYTGNGGSQDINLGYEPQWLLIKRTTNADANAYWAMEDIMRGGLTANGNVLQLRANSSQAEDALGGVTTGPRATSTGFQYVSSALAAYNGNGETYVYIAIRRGPMKVPTTGTSVFQPVTYSGNGSNNRLVDTTITPDLFIDMRRDNVMNKYVLDRLRGNGRLYSDLSNAESSNTAQIPANTFNVNQTGVTVSADEVNASGRTFVLEAFRRAPSFFDVVCYSGTGVATTITHNLAAVPELMIVKQRSNTNNGAVYTASGGTGVYLRLFSTSSDSGNTSTTGDELWNSTTPTSSVFSVNASARVNGSGSTYVAYLFATCAGVSKVGSYTGTGATQTINCGFTGGARFVLIKKSTSTAPDRDWYVWDTARGMTSGTDPSLKINTTAAEVNANDVYTITTGFQLVSSSDYVNASGVTYIFLAIA